MMQCWSNMRSDGVVSILTQPEGWVPFVVPCGLVSLAVVSILTQPEGWVPFLLLALTVSALGCFNPHPTRRLGAICLPIVC